jgi:hypothetical protein
VSVALAQRRKGRQARYARQQESRGLQVNSCCLWLVLFAYQLVQLQVRAIVGMSPYLRPMAKGSVVPSASHLTENVPGPART